MHLARGLSPPIGGALCSQPHRQPYWQCSKAQGGAGRGSISPRTPTHPSCSCSCRCSCSCQLQLPLHQLPLQLQVQLGAAATAGAAAAVAIAAATAAPAATAAATPHLQISIAAQHTVVPHFLCITHISYGRSCAGSPAARNIHPENRVQGGTCIPAVHSSPRNCWDPPASDDAHMIV